MQAVLQPKSPHQPKSPASILKKPRDKENDFPEKRARRVSFAPDNELEITQFIEVSDSLEKQDTTIGMTEQVTQASHAAAPRNPLSPLPDNHTTFGFQGVPFDPNDLLAAQQTTFTGSSAEPRPDLSVIMADPDYQGQAYTADEPEPKRTKMHLTEMTGLGATEITVIKGTADGSQNVPLPKFGLHWDFDDDQLATKMPGTAPVLSPERTDTDMGHREVTLGLLSEGGRQAGPQVAAEECIDEGDELAELQPGNPSLLSWPEGGTNNTTGLLMDGTRSSGGPRLSTESLHLSMDGEQGAHLTGGHDTTGLLNEDDSLLPAAAKVTPAKPNARAPLPAAPSQHPVTVTPVQQSAVVAPPASNLPPLSVEETLQLVKDKCAVLVAGPYRRRGESLAPASSQNHPPPRTLHEAAQMLGLQATWAAVCEETIEELQHKSQELMKRAAQVAERHSAQNPGVIHRLRMPIDSEELAEITEKIRMLKTQVASKAAKEKQRAKVELQQKYAQRLKEVKEQWTEYFNRITVNLSLQDLEHGYQQILEEINAKEEATERHLALKERYEAEAQEIRERRQQPNLELQRMQALVERKERELKEEQKALEEELAAELELLQKEEREREQSDALEELTQRLSQLQMQYKRGHAKHMGVVKIVARDNGYSAGLAVHAVGELVFQPEATPEGLTFRCRAVRSHVPDPDYRTEGTRAFKRQLLDAFDADLASCAQRLDGCSIHTLKMETPLILNRMLEMAQALHDACYHRLIRNNVSHVGAESGKLTIRFIRPCPFAVFVPIIALVDATELQGRWLTVNRPEEVDEEKLFEAVNEVAEKYGRLTMQRLHDAVQQAMAEPGVLALKP